MKTKTEYKTVIRNGAVLYACDECDNFTSTTKGGVATHKRWEHSRKGRKKMMNAVKLGAKKASKTWKLKRFDISKVVSRNGEHREKRGQRHRFGIYKTRAAQKQGIKKSLETKRLKFEQSKLQRGKRGPYKKSVATLQPQPNTPQFSLPSFTHTFELLEKLRRVEIALRYGETKI